MKNFDIKIENLEENQISLRFWSSDSVELKIKDIKYFYSHKQCGYEWVRPVIKLENSHKIESFKCPNNQPYNIITFLISQNEKKDSGYSVIIDLQEEKIDIKETDFHV